VVIEVGVKYPGGRSRVSISVLACWFIVIAGYDTASQFSPLYDDGHHTRFWGGS
jgi:hypothetical protein